MGLIKFIGLGVFLKTKNPDVEIGVFGNTIDSNYFPSTALTSPLIFRTFVGVSAFDITVIAFRMGPTRFVSYFT